MKIVKIIGIVVACILAIPFVVALFMPKDFVVEQEIVVNKPEATVFEYIKHLKNQLEYSKWMRIDPAMKTNYTGADGTVGFVMAWNSDNKDVGQGQQRITKIDD